jgi:hypothetical protein
MSPESLLAEKLGTYRDAFDKACRELVSGGDGGDSNRGSNCAKQIRAALRFIADDFAHEFNAKLAAAAQSDPTVELVADKYEMSHDHVVELESLIAAPVKSLLGKLDAGDLDGARNVAPDAWPLLERRIRNKWQAYFVLTFQDVSVERKAARDRKKLQPLQPRFDAPSMERMASADSMRNSMPDFAPPLDDRRARSAWLTVAALVLLAAACGWLLLHHHHLH